MKLLIATGNAHKLEEIRQLFSVPGIDLIGLSDLPEPAPEVPETGLTFEANALQKAVGYAAFADMWALADDSGLVVDALDGEPGIYSARYAGTHGDDAGNNRKVLEKLVGVPDSERGGRFVCAVAIAHPDGTTRVLEAACEGRIDHEETGDHGFGYDPMFIPEGHAQSFGVLDAAIKAEISHRSKAVRAAADAWSELLLGH